jgi:hypothetical protein
MNSAIISIPALKAKSLRLKMGEAMISSGFI